MRELFEKYAEKYGMYAAGQARDAIEGEPEMVQIEAFKVALANDKMIVYKHKEGIIDGTRWGYASPEDYESGNY